MIWQDIRKYDLNMIGVSVYLYAPEFEDDDFNPSGIIDGHWTEDEGWIGWRWNGCQDVYDTVEFLEPTLFAYKYPPNNFD